MSQASILLCAALYLSAHFLPFFSQDLLSFLCMTLSSTAHACHSPANLFLSSTSIYFPGLVQKSLPSGCLSDVSSCPSGRMCLCTSGPSILSPAFASGGRCRGLSCFGSAALSSVFTYFSRNSCSHKFLLNKQMNDHMNKSTNYPPRMK